MRRLKSFTFQSPDGFYKGPDELRFSERQMAGANVLVFGCRTYEHMAAF